MFEIFQLQILEKLLIAISLGFLVGLERENQRVKKGLSTFGGVRTFPIIALLGALSSYLLPISQVLSVVIWITVAISIIAAYVVVAFQNTDVKKSFGLTSELAALVVFFVGFMAFQGEKFLAVGITILLLILLYLKNPLHLLAEKVSVHEISSTIKFMIITFIILPILPNQYFGPFDSFNPYLIWLMVVFISGISFVSYLSGKLFGYRKGIGITGFLAGFISSTALALSFSGLSKDNKKIVSPYVFAILIASSAMFFRVLLEVFVVANDLFFLLLYPMVAMGVTGAIIAYYFSRKKDHQEKSVREKTLQLESPFRLKPALKFAAFFAGIFFVTKLALHYYGTSALYFTSFVSGLLDVDAITLSVAKLTSNGLDKSVAVIAITIAAITNTMVKGFIFLLFGSRKVAYNLLISFGIISLVGLTVSFVL